MPRNIRLKLALFATLGFVLLHIAQGFSTSFANYSDDPQVRVKFDKGVTELGTIAEGEKYFSNRSYQFQHVPAEIAGLTFTRRGGGPKAVVATIHAAAGTTVYVFTDEDTKSDLLKNGWARAGQFQYTDRKLTSLWIFKRQFNEDSDVEVSSGGWAGIVIAARNLTIDTGSDDDNGKGRREKKKTALPEANTLHDDPVPLNAPVLGPATRPANPQSTINALEVYQMADGMMVGQTSEATLTLTPSATPKLTTVRFITPIGTQMSLARDEALRFISLTYPNWYVSKAEITFEDKYVAHDGGSIGTAIGTMILSCIKGFTIDQDVAIIRAIGGVLAKIHGAIDSKCAIVAIPAANVDQLVDAVVYAGPDVVTDIQVIGVGDLGDAVALVRTDRDSKLQQAIGLFADVQKPLKDKPADVRSAAVQEKLAKVLSLAPQHLSAQVLVSIGHDKEPKFLSIAASQYYTYLSVGSMMDALKQRSDTNAVRSVPSSVVRTGLSKLQKLRTLADPTARPLIDAWVGYIEAWNDLQQGIGSNQTLEFKRQALLDELAKENTDPDMMQKRLREGV